MHAAWNFLLKRAGGSQVAVAQSKLVEGFVFLPLFLLWSAPRLPSPGVVLWLSGIAATGVMATYLALAGAYRHGDLSFVYPVSRGAALALLPPLGALTFGERLSPGGAIALVLIVGGIVALQLERLSLDAVRSLGSALGRPATRYALVAAVTTAAYTIWDKYAIRRMEPFAYMYTYTVIVALAYGAWVRRRVPAEERASTWQQHRWAIVGIGVLNTLSYLLTLIALRDDTSSLVIGLRQLSIVFGVLLGAALLGERLTPPRVVGVAMIGIGCVTIALS